MGELMRRFVEQADRGQSTLLPECLDDFIDESNPVRVIDVFVDALDLAEMSFDGVEPAATGRPSYHPSVLLKLYIYGYLNRVQSSRRLEREAGRNVEVMWLLGRLAPDHKTIADFRKDNGLALRKVCARFVELCREMGLLATASVAIDGSKFKAVNNRDKNFTRAKVERRRAQLEESVERRTRLAVLYDGLSADQFAAAEQRARSLRLDVRSLKMENPPYDFDVAFRTLAESSPQMLLVLSSPFFSLSRSHIAELAIQQRLPTMFIFKAYAQAGGLISYGVDPPAIFRQLGFYVVKILNGTKPANLPVEQATKFELVLNQKTARAIGVELSTAIQLRADEVIE
jgi:transposase